MTRPLILAVDPDPETLSRIEQELSRRYGIDFRVRGESDGRAALATLDKAAEQGDPVALVLADPWLEDVSGTELLGRVRSLHPDAGRALLVPWGAWADRRTADAVVARAVDNIAPTDACGAHPLRGLLELSRRAGLDVELLDLRSSGDTAGDRTKVVGYGAFAVS